MNFLTKNLGAKSTVLFTSCGIPISQEERSSGKRDRGFDSGLLQRGVYELSVPCEASDFRFGSPAARRPLAWSRTAESDMRPRSTPRVLMRQNAWQNVFPLTRQYRVGTLLMFAVRNIFSQPGRLQRTMREWRPPGWCRRRSPTVPIRSAFWSTGRRQQRHRRCLPLCAPRAGRRCGAVRYWRPRAPQEQYRLAGEAAPSGERSRQIGRTVRPSRRVGLDARISAAPDAWSTADRGALGGRKGCADRIAQVPACLGVEAHGEGDRDDREADR